MDCLNNVVGLIGSADNCLPDVDVVTSLSGLYLDDTNAGNIPLKASFWTNYDRINRIIPDAVKEALTATRKVIDQKLGRNFRTHQTRIGYKDDWTDYISATAGYYVLAIRPRKIKGGTIRINNIDIYTENGLHGGDITVIQGGVSNLFTVPQNFNTYGNIYIAYQGDRPRNFTHSGCCGKTPTYNGWVNIGGGVFDDLTNLEYQTNNLCYGMELDITFDCDGFSDDIFCNIDYNNSNFGVAFASLIQLIARKNIAYNILTSDVITPYLVTNKEEVQQIITYLTNEIEITLTYLKESYGHSDCYRCNGVYKGEILI